jgi:hypothetical protein
LWQPKHALTRRFRQLVELVLQLDHGRPRDFAGKKKKKKYRRFTGRKSAKIQYKALQLRGKIQSARNREEQEKNRREKQAETIQTPRGPRSSPQRKNPPTSSGGRH